MSDSSHHVSIGLGKTSALTDRLTGKKFRTGQKVAKVIREEVDRSVEQICSPVEIEYHNTSGPAVKTVVAPVHRYEPHVGIKQQVKQLNRRRLQLSKNVSR